MISLIGEILKQTKHELIDTENILVLPGATDRGKMEEGSPKVKISI